jgi:hypothetical protein
VEFTTPRPPGAGAPVPNENNMRTLLTVAAFAAGLAVGPALAETQTFVIANQPDAYGVDRCLATGAQCGAVVATAYCQSRDFAQAVSFRRVERTDITATLGTTASCGRSCGELVAIECTR